MKLLRHCFFEVLLLRLWFELPRRTAGRVSTLTQIKKKWKIVGLEERSSALYLQWQWSKDSKHLVSSSCSDGLQPRCQLPSSGYCWLLQSGGLFQTNLPSSPGKLGISQCAFHFFRMREIKSFSQKRCLRVQVRFFGASLQVQKLYKLHNLNSNFFQLLTAILGCLDKFYSCHRTAVWQWFQ